MNPEEAQLRLQYLRDTGQHDEASQFEQYLRETGQFKTPTPHMDKLALARRQAQAPQEPDAAGPGYFERLATHVLNAGQGIPGVEAVEAGAGMLGSKLTAHPMSYEESLNTLRDATGQIGGKTAGFERAMGSVATLPFLPAGPGAAGAVLGGADQLLNADPNQSLLERGARTAGGAGLGYLFGKGADMALTGGRSLLSTAPAKNLIERQIARAASAKRLYGAALAEGQGKAASPQLQEYLAEPDVAEIVSELQSTRAFKGMAPESPEMLDAIYKTLSDRAATIKKGLVSVSPTKPNIGRFQAQNISAAQQKLLDIISGTKETISSAALKHPDGTITTAPTHFDALLKANSSHGIQAGDFGEGADGFVTSTGRFVTRKEAEEIALRSGQAASATNERGLHSDDLTAKVGGATMPTYREAVADFAKHKAAEDAVARGYDAVRSKLLDNLPTAKNLTRSTPEAFAKWADTASPDESKAAVEGILGATKMALKKAPLTKGRKALWGAGSLLRAANDQTARNTRLGILAIRH